MNKNFVGAGYVYKSLMGKRAQEIFIGKIPRHEKIARDQEALKRLVEMIGKMLTPVIEAHNEVIVEFDKPAIDRLLGL